MNIFPHLNLNRHKHSWFDLHLTFLYENLQYCKNQKRMESGINRESFQSKSFFSLPLTNTHSLINVCEWKGNSAETLWFLYVLVTGKKFTLNRSKFSRHKRFGLNIFRIKTLIVLIHESVEKANKTKKTISYYMVV